MKGSGMTRPIRTRNRLVAFSAAVVLVATLGTAAVLAVHELDFELDGNTAPDALDPARGGQPLRIPIAPRCARSAPVPVPRSRIQRASASGRRSMSGFAIGAITGDHCCAYAAAFAEYSDASEMQGSTWTAQAKKRQPTACASHRFAWSNILRDPSSLASR